jgi:polysaccharide transporter, PST family
MLLYRIARVVGLSAMSLLETWTRYLPDPLRSRLEGGPSLWRLISNILWLFADRIMRLGVGLLVSIWITRYLGPEQFGTLNYAIAFVALLVPISYAGLDNIVVRDLVREPESTNSIVGSAFLLKLVFGGAALVAALMSAAIFESGDPLMLALIAISATILLFQAFDAIDFWFQSHVRSKYSVLARNASFLTVAAIRLCLVLSGAPLIAFAIAAALEYALSALGLVVVYRLNGQRLADWSPTKARAAALFNTSWPVMLSAFAFAVSMRIDQIVVAEILGKAELGIYAAAVRLSEFWYMVPAVIIHSVAPALARAKKADAQLYRQRTQRLLNLMVGLAYLVALPTTFLAGPLVRLLYGPEFAAAGPVLAVHIWGVLFMNIGGVHNLWIIHEGLTRYALLSTSIGALSSIGINLLLIPQLGPLGAAIAAIISYAITFTVVCLCYRPTRPLGKMMLKALALRS